MAASAWIDDAPVGSFNRFCPSLLGLSLFDLLGAPFQRRFLTPSMPPTVLWLSWCARRKLSGAFLACMKLRARVPCRQLFYDAYDKFDFEEISDRAEQEAMA